MGSAQTAIRLLAMFRIAPTLVLLTAFGSVASAATQPEPRLTNVTTRSLPLVDANLADVVSARLYQSTDAGATWTKVDEIAVTPEVAPRFTFTAPGDGVFHLYSTVTYRNGNREAEPVAGAEAKLVLQVDTRAPSIASFKAEVQERTGSHLHVRLAWAVADEALDAQPVTVEASLDGGASFAPLTKGGPTGSIVLPVALTAGTSTVHIRLSANDRAGNLAVSETQALRVEPAPAAATEPEPAPTPPTTTADPAAVTTEPAPAASDAAALAAALAALPTVTVDPNRPEIVVPERTTPADAPDEVPIAQDQGLEREWAEHQARTAPAAAGTGWQRPTRTAPAAAPGAALTPAAPEDLPPPTTAATAPAATAPATTAPVAPLGVTAAPKPDVMPPGVPPAGRLSPSQADILLKAARSAVQDGDLSLASARYRRLRDSAIAESAILEEVRAWRESGDPSQARAIVTGLRPAERTNKVIIEEGRCLIALGRPQDAMTMLTQVRAEGPEGSEALFVIAQTLESQGRKADARKVLTFVASGNGPWADKARAELGR